MANRIDPDGWEPKFTSGGYHKAPHSFGCTCWACKPPWEYPWLNPASYGYSVSSDKSAIMGDPPPGYHIVMRLEKINPTKIERPEDV